MAKILVADDEAKVLRLITGALKAEGHEVVQASDGQDALNKFYDDEGINLCILDVMMPKISGYKVCEIIKQNSQVPILILTAKTEEEAQVDAFKFGADDYMAKPFSILVLGLRIKALLKRYNIAQTPPEIMTFEGIEVNTISHEVRVNGEKTKLTPKEYELLVHFLKNQNVVISRAQLMQSVWNYEFCGDERTVDTHIKNLRKKLDEYGDRIHTIREYGYKLV